MKLSHLRGFVAIVDADLHVPRASEASGIPMASLYTSLERLEEETGHPLIVRGSPRWTLTPAGDLLLVEARHRIADAPDTAPAPKAGGGKARASKGKGRAPIVKGQPKPYKKRQGR